MPLIQIQPYGELDKKIECLAESWGVSKADAVIKILEKFEVING